MLHSVDECFAGMDLPLRLRIITASERSHSPHVETTKHTHRYGRYKLWTEEQMHMALDAVLNHRSTVTQAAAEYGVPVSTLGTV